MATNPPARQPLRHPLSRGHPPPPSTRPPDPHGRNGREFQAHLSKTITTQSILMQQAAPAPHAQHPTAKLPQPHGPTWLHPTNIPQPDQAIGHHRPAIAQPPAQPPTQRSGPVPLQPHPLNGIADPSDATSPMPYVTSPNLSRTTPTQHTPRTTHLPSPFSRPKRPATLYSPRRLTSTLRPWNTSSIQQKPSPARPKNKPPSKHRAIRSKHRLTMQPSDTMDRTPTHTPQNKPTRARATIKYLKAAAIASADTAHNFSSEEFVPRPKNQAAVLTAPATMKNSKSTAKTARHGPQPPPSANPAKDPSLPTVVPPSPTKPRRPTHADTQIEKPTRKLKNRLNRHKHKFYAVAVGRKTGIYTSWPITHMQVNGYSGALFEGFHQYAEAQRFLLYHSTSLKETDRAYLSTLLDEPAFHPREDQPTPQPNQAHQPDINPTANPTEATNPTYLQAASSTDSATDASFASATVDSISASITQMSSLDGDERSYTSFMSDMDGDFPNKFFVMLRIRHKNIEEACDEQAIETILTTTLAHHQQRLPGQILLFCIGPVHYLQTRKVTDRSTKQAAHYYRLTLLPNTAEDQFDPELFFEQCLTFSLQKWHLHCNQNFGTDQALIHKRKSPPSPNPWAPHIELLLPGCNNTSDTAMGCLIGIPPDFFGGSRRAAMDILAAIQDHIKPHLPDTPIAQYLQDWYSFQEYFGLRPSTIPNGSKKAKVFFICCYCEDAWDILLTASNAAGPLNIHGCLTKVSVFPPPPKKQEIVTKTNQLLAKFRQFHEVHTDRLRLVNTEDEHSLLSLTPNLVALAPKFVDHLPSPVCHTLFFQADPTTLALTNQTLSQAHIPPHLLAPVPKSPLLKAGTIRTTAVHPRQQRKTLFDETNLDDIFNQWNNDKTTDGFTEVTKTSKPTKRARPAPTFRSPTPTRTQDSHQPIPAQEAHQEESPTPPLSQAAPQETTPAPKLSDNYYASLQSNSESGSDHSDSESESNTDNMSTDDHTNRQPPPTVDFGNFEAALSQEALLQFRQLDEVVRTDHPDKHVDFQHDLHNAMLHNEDPAHLHQQVMSWPTSQHP